MHEDKSVQSPFDLFSIIEGYLRENYLILSVQISCIKKCLSEIRSLFFLDSWSKVALKIPDL